MYGVTKPFRAGVARSSGERSQTNSLHCGRPAAARDEQGTATLTAVLILALLSLFAAATLNKVTMGTAIMNNDYANTKAYYAAQASLEEMSRNFTKLFTYELKPTNNDIEAIETTYPKIPGGGFTFTQTIAPDTNPLRTSGTLPIASGPFAGLVSIRNPYVMDVFANYSGTQVHLTRTFYNHQVPIFQFGIFYNNDMEIYAGPAFNFGGRVHSNGNIYLLAGSGNLYFTSRVTAAGEIVRDVNRNGKAATAEWTGSVWIADPSGTPQQLQLGQGSCLNGPLFSGSPAGSNPEPSGSPNADSTYAAWLSFSSIFGGNLLAHQPVLRLPLQIGTGADPIEIVRRGLGPADLQVTKLGQSVDSPIAAQSRYYNKPGIRVTLSDAQIELPGGTGGVRLDGSSDGSANSDTATTGSKIAGSRGYQPLKMKDGYQGLRVNANRLYTGTSNDNPTQNYANFNPAGIVNGGLANTLPSNRQTWIKVEIVNPPDPNTGGITTSDITQDFLSLGVTHFDPNGMKLGDSRAILKMQRFEVLGPPIRVADLNGSSNTAAPSTPSNQSTGSLPAFSYYSGGSGINYVSAITDTSGSATANAMYDTTEVAAHGVSTKDPANSSQSIQVVPFPIELFDTREGLFNENMVVSGGSTANLNWNTDYPLGNVPVVGVMSLIDVDVYNLMLYLHGDFDTKFPLQQANSTNIVGAQAGGNGVILYVSDRRGDANDNGAYDMEDIFGPNDGILQVGEDVNHDGVLAMDYSGGPSIPNQKGGNGWESAPYTTSIASDIAATFDHIYYRRGVRMINAAQLPGLPNQGFTLASENGVYTLGNFNSVGVSAGMSGTTPTQPLQYYETYSPTDPNPPTNPAPASLYPPLPGWWSTWWKPGGPVQVPCSIVADAITVLSNAWADGNSFRNPLNPQTGTSAGPRIAAQTTVRAAFLMGSPIAELTSTPNQGGQDTNLDGGVHNFPRFLENWGSTTLNYCGSLINLFNSRVSNGAYKNGSGHVYTPPKRNWVFDSSFTDATRLPPGTPFLQFLQMTGIRETLAQEQ